ncbi:MAG TPA: type II toxin-antitoxin system YhaV family toxin [Rhodopila sp.]|jgi:toxin YhaV
MGLTPSLSVNGWTILLHPLFLDQVAVLVGDIRRAKQKDPVNFRIKNSAKRLAAILKLAFEDIPQNPAAPVYRQGGTLGPEYTHWLRAKFFQQYRLFFRFDTRSKVIIYAWVNDEDTKRAYDSKTDAYAIFRGMLLAKNPPNDWAALRTACETEAAQRSTDGDTPKTGLMAAIRGITE